MNITNNERECPKCEGREFGTGKQKGYAKMSSGLFNSGSNLIHIICTNFGLIVESYAEKPQNFQK